MTREKKKVARIPTIASGMSVIQPNRVTETSFKGFTLIMHKIFTAIQMQLQDAVQHSMNDQIVSQLDLFSNNSNDVVLKIAYSSIIKTKTHYDDVRKALMSMATLAAEIPYKDENGKSMLLMTGLLKAVIPERPDFSSEIEIRIDKRMAHLLVEVDKNSSGGPINFTKFSYDVAQSATCLHTPPLYKILSSWKSKEFFKIKYSELRNMLGINEDQYAKFSDFKRRVLQPVLEDLKNVSDVWFSYEHYRFKTKENGELWLMFKVLTRDRQQLIDKKTESIRFTLVNFGLKPDQNAVLDEILNDESITRESIYTKIMEIEDFIYKNNTDHNKAPIENKQAYMVSSLRKAFKKN